MEFQNIKDVLTHMYSNSLQSTDLQPSTTINLFKGSYVYSNLLQEAIVVDDLNLVVYNSEGRKAFDFYPTGSSTSSIITTYIDEGVYRKVGDADMFAQDMEIAIANKVDKAFIDYFSTKANASTLETGLDIRLRGLKRDFGNKSFVIVAGFDDFLAIQEKYHGTFPYKVIYSPFIEDGKLYAFRENRLFVNARIGNIDMRKNVLTGQYVFSVNIMNLQVGCDEVFKA